MRLWRVHVTSEKSLAKNGDGFFDRTEGARSIDIGMVVDGKLLAEMLVFHGWVMRLGCEEDGLFDDRSGFGLLCLHFNT